jgi:MFS family permease
VTVTERPRLWTPQFALAVVTTTVLFFGFYLLIPTLPPHVERLGASKSQVGLAMGLFSLGAVAIRVATGARMDRYGRRPFLLGGLALFVAATALYGVAGSLPALLAVRLLHGFGWGWTLTALGSLVADLAPPARRGEAMGCWGLAPTVAMALGPAAGGALQELGGADSVFLGTAGLGLLAGLMALALHDTAHREEPDRLGGSWPPGAWLPSAVAYLASLSYGAMIAFLPVELAAAPRRAGAFFTLYALTILVTRPAAGWLSDRWGRTAVVHPGLLVGALGTALLGLAARGEALAVAAVLYGAGISGAVFPGLMAMTVDRCPASKRGAALAVYFSAYDLSLASGAILLGPVYQAAGFPAMCLAAAAAVLAGQGVLWRGARRARPARSLSSAGPAAGTLRGS